MEIPEEDDDYKDSYDSDRHRHKEEKHNPFKQKKEEKEEWSPIPKRFQESYNHSSRVQIDYDNEI